MDIKGALRQLITHLKEQMARTDLIATNVDDSLASWQENRRAFFARLAPIATISGCGKT